MSLLREARAKAGITQKQLAEKAGVSNETIVRLERYESAPRPETIRKLADALDIPFADLERDLTRGRRKMEQETKVSVKTRWRDQDNRMWVEILRFTGEEVDSVECGRDTTVTLYEGPRGYRVYVDDRENDVATLHPQHVNRYTGETEYPVYDKDNEEELRELVEEFPEFGATVGVYPVRDLD